MEEKECNPFNQNHTFDPNEAFSDFLKRGDRNMFVLYDLLKNMMVDYPKNTAYIRVKRSQSDNTAGKKIESECLTTNEVVLRFKISKRTLQKLRDTKQIKFSNKGKKCRYKLEDIQEFLYSK
jgi:hypothetical protein